MSYLSDMSSKESFNEASHTATAGCIPQQPPRHDGLMSVKTPMRIDDHVYA